MLLSPYLASETDFCLGSREAVLQAIHRRGFNLSVTRPVVNFSDKAGFVRVRINSNNEPATYLLSKLVPQFMLVDRGILHR